jgi:hypothetical protein
MMQNISKGQIFKAGEWNVHGPQICGFLSEEEVLRGNTH